MPKGFHYGRSQTRHYTCEHLRISARLFKNLLDLPLGQYSFNSTQLSDEHRTFKLIEFYGSRVAIFSIKGRDNHVTLQVDKRSASNKLFLVCPYCRHQRQHLYAVSNAYSCRTCLGLHYASQSERPMDRLARRIRKERSTIWGDEQDTVNLIDSSSWWPKPKWMKYKTFDKARSKLIVLESRYWQLASSQFNIMFGKDIESLDMY
jgi:hypothetical protein